MTWNVNTVISAICYGLKFLNFPAAILENLVDQSQSLSHPNLFVVGSVVDGKSNCLSFSRICTLISRTFITKLHWTAYGVVSNSSSFWSVGWSVRCLLLDSQHAACSSRIAQDREWRERGYRKLSFLYVIFLQHNIDLRIGATRTGTGTCSLWLTASSLFVTSQPSLFR